MKCPKCRGKQLQIIEHIVVPEVMYQNEKEEISNFSGECHDCYVIKWVATCLKCKYTWTLRQYPRSDRIDYPPYMTKEEKALWLEGKYD